MSEDRTIWWWVLGAFVVVAGVGVWWWWHGHTAAPLPIAPVAEQRPPAPGQSAVEAPIEHPIEAAPAAVAARGGDASLPPLSESDSALRSAIGSLIGDQALVEFVRMTGIVASVVATVDNLPRRKVATKILPVRGPAGAFVVEEADGGRVIGSANAVRYAAHLRLLENVDSQRVAAVYVRFYPLLQQAYRELGYPQGNFNDRLVTVIDHLLATPAIEGPMRVVQPKVLYEFADPDLEARSAGQKLLLRMGAENAERVKARLREFRREITAAPASLKETPARPKFP